MLVPSRELLVQNHEKLKHLANDINIGIISASAGRKDLAINQDVIIATVGSVVRNPGALGRLDLIICDECHLINNKQIGQYRQLIEECQRYNPALRIIGMTGTPFRGNGVWLTAGDKRLFTDIAARVSMRELLDQGFLSPLELAETQTHIDASDVRLQNGDYVISELAKRIDQDELTQSIARQIVKIGSNRKKWLVYCVTVQHATHMADELNSLGIKTAVISAKTPKVDRNQVIYQFKTGRIRCICNVAVLTTGFDVPELDLIALVRNTQSPVLYTQIAGRGMRRAEGKTDCLWLDFTDTTAKLGPVDQISGKGEPKKQDNPEAPHKICPDCGTNCAATALECENPECGYKFPVPKPKINETLSKANIISKMELKTYHINRVTYLYHKNKSPDNPPTLKVSYWTPLRLICSEWVCLEHSGYARAKAEKWWDKRFNHSVPLPTPKTIKRALDLTEFLIQPKQIIVKEGGKWSKLMICIF